MKSSNETLLLRNHRLPTTVAELCGILPCEYELVAVSRDQKLPSKEGYNCGSCLKCWRTMLEMEVLGVLDLFQDSFDVASFRKRKDNYITEMISRIYKESLMRQIYDYMKLHQIKIPLKCLIRGNIRRIHRILHKMVTVKK